MDERQRFPGADIFPEPAHISAVYSAVIDNKKKYYEKSYQNSGEVETDNQGEGKGKPG